MDFSRLTNPEAYKKALAGLLRRGEEVTDYIATAPEKAGQSILDARQRQSALMDKAFDPTGKTLIRDPEAFNQAAMNLFEGPMSFAPIGMLAPAKFVGKTLEGMPDKVKVGDKVEQFGTDQRLVDIAQQYAADKGLGYKPLTTYTEVDADRAKRLALAYQLMKNEPNNPAVKKAYSNMIDETMDQYDALRRQGYKFDFMPQGVDLYGNPRNAINDIVTNKRLSVFPTIQGFGGPSAAVASEANPLLLKTGEKWGGQDVTANDVFRAVHDVFGHAKHGVGFRAAGEENAFQSHARMYSPKALPAATSETRGQNSWVNFGPYGDINRSANPLLTEYAEQKTGIMPAWTYLEGIAK
jgi:hypothetical protein